MKEFYPTPWWSHTRLAKTQLNLWKFYQKYYAPKCRSSTDFQHRDRFQDVGAIPSGPDCYCRPRNVSSYKLSFCWIEHRVRCLRNTPLSSASKICKRPVDWPSPYRIWDSEFLLALIGMRTSYRTSPLQNPTLRPSFFLLFFSFFSKRSFYNENDVTGQRSHIDAEWNQRWMKFNFGSRNAECIPPSPSCKCFTKRLSILLGAAIRTSRLPKYTHLTFI